MRRLVHLPSGPLGRARCLVGLLALLAVGALALAFELRGAMGAPAALALAGAQLAGLAVVAAVVSSLAAALDREERAMAEARSLATSADVRLEGENRFRHLVQSASDMIWVISPDSTVSYVSPSVTRILGYSCEELLGTRLLDIVHPEDRERVIASYAQVLERPGMSPERIEVRWRHRDGFYLHVESARTNLLHEPAVGGVILTSRDITDRKALEGQLTHQAFHDPLTKLANRALFRNRVDHALAARSRGAGRLAVLFLDLDEFKTLNDSLGHLAGDRLLVETAVRVLDCLRPGDTAARLGGDEFAVLLPEVVDAEAPVEVAERIGAALAEPFEIDGRRVSLSASVGIVESGPSGVAADDLLRDADLAMYEAKDHGKARHEVFRDDMRAGALRRLALIEDMRRSVDEGQLQLRYQPVVDLHTGCIVGAEALARWNHPEHGLLSPSEWVPAAEGNGSIVSVGRWVLEQSCRQLAAWQRQYPRDPLLSMTVNVSVRQLDEAGFAAEVERLLDATGVAPANLVLEITEHLALGRAEATATRLRELKDLGVRIAIDDFGTGYASLDYLSRFPIDSVKIAKTFVDHLSPDGAEPRVARGIVELGRTLGLEVVAEGIETAGQLDELRELGCQLGQGYHFARPLSVPELSLLLRSPRLMSPVSPRGRAGRRVDSASLG